jgi:hypothetical protein
LLNRALGGYSRDDEALAALLGLVGGRRAGLITAASAAGETARGAVAHQLRDDPRGPHAESRYGPLLPHVVDLDMAASDDPACRRCLLDVAQYLTVRADAGTARTLAERALRRWRSELAPDDPMLLDAAAQLAQAYYWPRDYAQAAALDEAEVRAQSGARCAR